MAKTVVGIDIGSAGIRAVEIGEADKPRPTLLRYHEIAVPEGAVVRGEVVETNTVASALKQLWSTGGFTSKNVILGMGNHRVLARDLSVPRMSLRRIRESLPFQVQDMIPMPVSEALLDFYPISVSDGDAGEQVNGLLIAAAKDAVLGNVRAVQLAGLHPMEVDLIPFALIRALLRGEQAAGTVAIVDIGASTTTVVIASGGVPQFIRIIPTGSDDLTQALKTRLEVDLGKAESVKRTLGLTLADPASDNSAALGIIHELTGELLGSLRNTLNYFVNTRSHLPVRRIIVAGGGAELPGFVSALAEITRLSVDVANPFAAVSVHRGTKQDDPPRQSRGATIALGLALRSAA